MCLLVEAHPLMCLHIISSTGEKMKPVAAGQECHKDGFLSALCTPTYVTSFAFPRDPTCKIGACYYLHGRKQGDRDGSGAGLRAKEVAHSIMSAHDGQKSEFWLPLPRMAFPPPPVQLL